MRLIIPKRPAVKVEGAFSTTLYTGNGATQDITTGIDLSNHDGLVWIKQRDDTGNHHLFDTQRGANKYLSTNSTGVETTVTTMLMSFNINGFSLGDSANVNGSAELFASWTFRKARRFFDVAEVTKASGSDATVSFPTLGTLGMVTVKRTDSTGSWYVWHKDLTAGKLLYLDTTAVEATLGHITVSGTTVTLENGVIADGDYIIYAWAHDTNSRGIVQCGSYTGNGSVTGPVIDLGWMPQYLMIKSIDLVRPWVVYDAARSPTNPRRKILYPSETAIEGDSSTFGIDFLSTGFQPITSGLNTNDSGTYIYLAIREE